MKTETVEYLKMAHKADSERGGHCNYSHKFTLEESEKAAQLVFEYDVTPQQCATCDYYHLVKSI